MITYTARWVLPICAPPIEHGGVTVDGDRIAYVGPRANRPSSDHVDLGDAMLMPGLVNAHSHLELTVMRGFLEDLDFPRWILRLNGVKRAVLDRDRMLDAARLGLMEGVRHGVTTYADTCDSGVAFDAMLEAGVRGIMYQEVFGPDPARCDESLAALREKVAELRPRETSLVRVGVSPHAPYTVSDALYSAVARYAEEENLAVAVHIAESEAERQLVTAADGVFARGLRARGIDVVRRARSSIELLRSTGVLSRRPLLIHCVRLEESDADAVAASGSPVAHCPASNAKLGHGIAPLLELLDAGIVVGLGSDSVASNNRMDILAEARAAVLGQRARVGRHDALCARDALSLATLGGARALGLDSEIGTLEPGKSADLAAFPLDAHVLPVHDPESSAIFALPGVRASFVLVAGRELVIEGRLLADDPALLARVDDTARLMRAWAAAQDAAEHAPQDAVR